MAITTPMPKMATKARATGMTMPLSMRFLRDGALADFSELLGSGNDQEGGSLSVDEEDLGPDGEGLLTLGGFGHEKMPVPVGILNLDPPGRPLIQRSQGDLRNPSDKFVVGDRIGLLPRDDEGHRSRGETSGGKRQQEGQEARRQGRQGRPEADGDGLDHEA